MRVFNEEAKNNEIVLILKAKEVKIIIEVLMIVCKDQPRKTAWKKMANELDEKAAAY